MDTPSKSIHVNIFGDEYPLRADGDADTEYMTRVADHVDQAMRKIAERSPSLPPAKVAILAALNITDEMFSSQRENERKIAGVQARAQLLRERIDTRLPVSARTTPVESPSRITVSAN